MFPHLFSTKVVLLGALFSLSRLMSAGFAQEPTPGAKLDTLLEGQKKIITTLDRIHRQVEYSDPLADRTFGIEFNPAYLLLASADDQLVISSGFSLFKADRGAEIAFPIFYKSSNQEDSDITSFSIDSHYRRFLGKHQGGFYLSGSVRYKYVKGREDTDQIPFLNLSSGGEVITLHKFGVGFGIGYRYFSHSGFYWGTSLTMGRYFTGTDKQIKDDDLFNGKAYIDIELLKFGYAF
jgi:hypothetical protein